MSFAEGLAIACGIALGYWFVSSFLRGSDAGAGEADADAARERGAFSHATDDGTPAAPPDIPLRWHDVLQVEPDATADVITAAYRDRLAPYESARLEGLAPEVRALADEQVQRIQDAYVAAMRRHPGQLHA